MKNHHSKRQGTHKGLREFTLAMALSRCTEDGGCWLWQQACTNNKIAGPPLRAGRATSEERSCRLLFGVNAF